MKAYHFPMVFTLFNQLTTLSHSLYLISGWRIHQCSAHDGTRFAFEEEVSLSRVCIVCNPCSPHPSLSLSHSRAYLPVTLIWWWAMHSLPCFRFRKLWKERLVCERAEALKQSRLFWESQTRYMVGFWCSCMLGSDIIFCKILINPRSFFLNLLIRIKVRIWWC